MNFRACLHTADGGLSSDLAVDPSGQDTHQDNPGVAQGSPPTDTDGADPATPGGPSPYNASPPFSGPVTSDPEWLDPQGEQGRGQAIPHIEDPNVNEDRTTLHNAGRHHVASDSMRPEESPWGCTAKGCGGHGTHYVNSSGGIFENAGGGMLCREHAKQFDQFMPMFRNSHSVSVQQDHRFRDSEPRFDHEAALRPTLHNARRLSYEAKADRYGAN